MADESLFSDDELIDLYLAARRGDDYRKVVSERLARRVRDSPPLRPEDAARFDVAWSKGHAAYLRDLKRMKRRQGSDKLDAV